MKKRTNIVIDEEKVRLAKKAYNISTTKELVDFAVDQLLKAKQREEILKLQGKIKIDFDLDSTRKIR